VAVYGRASAGVEVSASRTRGAPGGAAAGGRGAVLSVEQRDALRLRVVEERSYAEVALLLGVSEQAARARVSRGLRALAGALEPYRINQELSR
jgi:predicted DNA-binding protein (UPF0251 family)